MSLQRVRCVWMVPLIISLIGCGETKSALGLAPPIHDESFEALLGHGDFSDRSSTPECLALRAEVDTSRNLVEGSSEMDNLEDTSAWQDLQSNYQAYQDADCPGITNAQDLSDTCSSLGEKVVGTWNDVQQTGAWQAAEENSDFKDLLTQWKRAKSINCINQ